MTCHRKLNLSISANLAKKGEREMDVPPHTEEMYDYKAKIASSMKRCAWERRNPLLRFMSNVIKDTKSPPANHLDIGVGSGYLLQLCSKAGYYCCGADLSGGLIHYLQKYFSEKDLNIEMKQCGADQLAFADNSFDIVTCFDCLEHLSPDVFTRALSEVRRVLRSDGVFIGTFPTNEVLKANSIMCPNCGHVFHAAGHLQSFTNEKMYKAVSPHFSNITFKQHSNVLLGGSSFMEWVAKIGLRIFNVKRGKENWTHFVAQNIV